ncbi:MAG: hypothetical protein FJ290_00670 [Planctomycetes bacterium]|nr:hypothetical protein [Planctomycetota bacterium]
MSRSGNEGVLASARAAALASWLLLGAGTGRADGLKIGNVAVAPRDATTAAVKFDISWENSWRHGSFHDAAWVFFKVQADPKAPWQPVRLAADKVVNPTGYSQERGGTPLGFIVPAGNEGFVGMFVRRTREGKGPVATQNVTAVWDFTANQGVNKDVKVRVQAFGVEMVYVPEGPFSLGSNGKEPNRFCVWTEGGQDTPPYRVTGPGPIPTGRQHGRLWAVGICPEDGGEVPASFPNGHAAFYCMKFPYLTRGQYAGFLGTLTAAQAKQRYYPGYQGLAIQRSGESPNYAYEASAPDKPCPWLSWADGAAYAAWAGLRPMTELEYEKATHGPRDDGGLSYWGLVGIDMGGVSERFVSVGSAAGRKFSCTHGRGTPETPADWPTDLGGVVFRGDYGGRGHLFTSGRMAAIDSHADRNTSAGWRAARSAPAGDTNVGRFTGPGDYGKTQPVARLGRGVRADGVLDEWGKPALVLTGPADVFPVYNRFAPFDFYGRLLRPWQGPEDLCAGVYLGWDGEALCVAAEVTDDRHFNAKTGDGIWSGDALQLGLVTAKGVRWKVALALTKAGVAFHQYAGEGDTLAKTTGCAATRDDKARVTRYELRLPLAALGLEPGVDFGVNMMFFDDDDGSGHRYWLQLAPGLAAGPASGGNTALYPRFVLEK